MVNSAGALYFAKDNKVHTHQIFISLQTQCGWDDRGTRIPIFHTNKKDDKRRTLSSRVHECANSWQDCSENGNLRYCRSLIAPRSFRDTQRIPTWVLWLSQSSLYTQIVNGSQRTQTREHSWDPYQISNRQPIRHVLLLLLKYLKLHGAVHNQQ